MPTVKNVALAPRDLPGGVLLRPGKTAELTDEQIAHPLVVALITANDLVNVDEAPDFPAATPDPDPKPKSRTRTRTKPKEQK